MGTSGLGALLVAEGLLSESDRRTIKKACGMAGAAFARSVVALGLLDEDELAAFLTDRTTWSRAPKNLTEASDKDALGALDRALLERLEALPLKLSDGVLEVAVTDPLDHDTLRQLAFFSGYRIVPVIATLTQIRKGLKQLYKGYRPPSMHLEQFLANHAAAASRRVQLQDKKRKPPSFAPPVEASEPVDHGAVIEDDEPFDMPPPIAGDTPREPAVLVSPDAAAADEPFAETGDGDALVLDDDALDLDAALPDGDSSVEQAASTAEPPLVEGAGDLELDFEAEASADLSALDALGEATPEAAAPDAPGGAMDDLFGGDADLEAEPAAATDDMNADLASDLLGEMSDDSALADAAAEVGDPFADVAVDDPLGRINGDATMDDIVGMPVAPAASAGPVIDLGGGEASAAAAERTAALNRAMLDLTMAADLAAGVRAVAPALHEAGLTRGLTLTQEGGNVLPIALWQPQAEGVTVRQSGLGGLVTPGMKDALSRLYPGWTPLSDAVREEDLAPLAEWSDAATELMATMAAAPGGKQLVVLASWQHERLKDEGLKSQTLDVIRKLAKKS